MLRTMDGRTAMVTGASGGIGRAVAVAFAEQSANVALGGRDAGALEQTAAQCRESGVAAVTVPFDVTDECACVDAVASIADTLGLPTVLVNAAGFVDSRKFTDVTVAHWREIMKVHVEGPLVLMRTVLPHMLSAGYGAIINIGSTVSSIGLPYAAPYTAAKHALLGLTRSAAAEYASRGITMNCVCPYYVDTPMTRQAIDERMRAKDCGYDEALRPMLNPQGRLVSTDEVAAVCVLLASPGGTSITGQALNVDGGRVQG